MNSIVNFLNTALDKMGMLNDQAKLSLTNLAVMVFMIIVGFRSLFAGLVLHFGVNVVWTVAPIDIASTLPMLYSLLNYGHKRLVTSQTQGTAQ